MSSTMRKKRNAVADIVGQEPPPRGAASKRSRQIVDDDAAWNQKFFDENMLAFRAGRTDKNPVDYWYKGEIGL